MCLCLEDRESAPVAKFRLMTILDPLRLGKFCSRFPFWGGGGESEPKGRGGGGDERVEVGGRK